MSSCQPHHYWLAWGHQGSPLAPLPVLATQRNSHHWGWSSPMRWSTHHPSCQKGESPAHQLHQFHQGITKSQLLAHGSFFWPSINKTIKEVVCQCETCTQFQSQNAAVPLTPTPTPSCPWQMCATDIFTLEGVDHLVVGNFYSKMILFDIFHPARVMPRRLSHCWKRCL